MQPLPSQRWTPVVLPVALRALLAVATRTYFQPDEFYQSLEPAHRLVFGYGALTWEWTVRPPLRSFAYAGLFVPVYSLVQALGLEQTHWLISAPKLLQGVLASPTDYYTYKLAQRVLGTRYANVALLLSLASFFHALSLTRTLSNSVETSLTVAALYYLPLTSADVDVWGPLRGRRRAGLVLAALACIMRPTSAVLWIFLIGKQFMHTVSTARLVFPLLIDTLIVGLGAAALLTAVDSVYYKQLTLTPLTFLRHNLLSATPISIFYGHNPWHYYILQALPLLLTTSLPFALHGMLISARGLAGESAHTLFLLICWTMGIFSVTGHKEWRFLHPLLPAMLVLASKSLVDTFGRRADFKTDGRTSGEKKSRLLPLPAHVLFLLLLSIPASVYVLLFHSRAQIDVMYYLRSLESSDLRSVGFLMPCHSTPWQAYLHREELEGGRLWALSCEPPVGLQGTALHDYRDQTMVFDESPASYLSTRFATRVDPSFPPAPLDVGKLGEENWTHVWPSHLVMFGALLEESGVRDILQERGYEEVWAAANGWEEDRRRRGGVKVWRWRSAPRVE